MPQAPQSYLEDLFRKRNSPLAPEMGYGDEAVAPEQVPQQAPPALGDRDANLRALESGAAQDNYYQAPQLAADLAPEIEHNLRAEAATARGPYKVATSIDAPQTLKDLMSTTAPTELQKQGQQAYQENVDYTNPNTQEVREGQEQSALDKLLKPIDLRGQYDVKVAHERAMGDIGAAHANHSGPTAGEPLVQTLNDAGDIEWTPRSGAAGKLAPGTGGEREAARTGASILDSLHEVMAMGERSGYSGVGLMGGLNGALYKYTGLGDSEGANFRQALQKLDADIMFGVGGKALTPMEHKVATGYLADIYTHPDAIPTLLKGLEAILTRAQSRRLGQGGPVQEEADEITDPNWGR